MWSRAAAWMLVIFWFSAAARAEDTISLGPIPIHASLTNANLEAPLSAALSIDSHGSVLNLSGAAELSVLTGTLAGKLQEIADKVFPYEFHTTKCDITFKKLTSIKVTPLSHEARLSGSAVLKLK